MKENLSWGRYPRNPQSLYPVFWQDALSGVISDLAERTGGGLLAFGLGRSYGDSCLAESDHVVAMQRLDRIISVDWENGVIVVQAGMSLADLIRYILPRGWFLPVTPGTKFVTLGGSVANDVHGKNHHVMGTFGCHVRRLVMYRSHEGVVECSPSLHPDLFAASIGGLGLTGIILAVELKLLRVSSSFISQRVIRFRNLDEFFAISEEHDRSYPYTVSWIDCLARGQNLGRGHYIVGDHANSGGLLPVSVKGIKIPFTPPFSLINGLSLKVFNSLYYNRLKGKDVSSIIDYDKFFYPLDGILEWNRIYGRAGFQQYQCVVPTANAKEAISEILNEISRSGNGSFLAVLKKCGDCKSPGLLSFPMPGTTLALDFPQKEPVISHLFERLDALVHEAGGRLYPAKDAHMEAEHFRQSYPSWPKLEKMRDPVLSSRFWRRVIR